ncbi:MAG: hypothetical protein OSB34_15160 [Planktomarina sp.]|nr:hypothetical protein [Planktomarina sp.]
MIPVPDLASCGMTIEDWVKLPPDIVPRRVGRAAGWAIHELSTPNKTPSQ